MATSTRNLKNIVKYRLTLSMCGGQLVPVASTGISSYFSKFIPVLLPENSSLKMIFVRVEGRQLAKSLFLIREQNLSYCSRRSLPAVGLDQSSSRFSSTQRLFPPPAKPPRSYLHTCNVKQMCQHIL